MSLSDPRYGIATESDTARNKLVIIDAKSGKERALSGAKLKLEKGAYPQLFEQLHAHITEGASNPIPATEAADVIKVV